MIVGDFDFICPGLWPGETDSVLPVYPNAVLALPITLQDLKPVPGWYRQVTQRYSGIKKIEFSRGYPQ